MTRFNEVELDSLISSMKVNPEWKSVFSSVAKKIVKNREIYEEISSKTNGVPWELIGAIHNLECSLRLDQHLHNGDPLTKRTRLVPAGRPKLGKPPFTFVESAVDAITMKGWDKISDWSDARVAYELERYNGFGYRSRGVLSPYVWSGTNHYTKGKYVRDRVYDRNAVSKQTGAYPLYMAIKDEAMPYTKKEVVASSRKLSLLQRARVATTTALGGFFTVDTLNIAKDTMTQLKDFMAANAVILTVVGVGSVIAVFKIIEHMSVQDANDGRYVPSALAKEDE